MYIRYDARTLDAACGVCYADERSETASINLIPLIPVIVPTDDAHDRV